MSMKYSRPAHRALLASAALMILLVPWSLAYASKSIHEQRPAAANGMVEIVCLAGSVQLSGWDRPEVEVTGKIDDNVESVDVTTSGDRTSINVAMRAGMSWRKGEVRLEIHVPAASSVTATLVSADLEIADIQGDVKLQTVSGSISGKVGGDVRANTVSGSVRLTAPDARMIDIRTIAGDIALTGGGGEVEITTVSGNAKALLGALARGRFRSVAGKISAEFALAPAGRFDAESVSGDVRLDFAAEPGAEFDVQSISGKIDACFGPTPIQPRYGPGSRLAFKNGDGRGRVRVETKSGDVDLCGKGLRGKKAAELPMAPGSIAQRPMAPAPMARMPLATSQPAMAPVSTAQAPARCWSKFYVL